MHFKLLKLLADGKFHSGEILANQLQISRTAIWKMIPRIQDLGLELHSVKGKGYRLFEPVNLLDKKELLNNIPEHMVHKLQDIRIFPTIESTSSYAMQLVQSKELDLKDNKVFVCLAEQQTSGKGRRGKVWVSPFGNNLYLTLVREFSTGVSELEGLSLVIGLAVIRVLQARQIQGLGIKWPNDILWQGKKLAGILLEVSGDPTGLSQVLIGLGLNVSANKESMQAVDQEWIDLKTLGKDVTDRNSLAAELITEIVEMVEEFEAKGFVAFKAEWDKNDALKDQQVELKTSSNQPSGIKGKVLGVSDQGALMLQTESGVETFHGGEVSPRLVQAKSAE